MNTLRAMWLYLLAALIGFGGAATAQSDSETLAQVLRLDEVIAVLHDEGVAYGAEIDHDMLDGQGGAYWTKEVARIYTQDLFAEAVKTALSSAMTQAERVQATAFFDTELGQRILSLENAARIAMADTQVEQIARDSYDSLKGTDDQRLMAVSRFAAVNDLVERNVAGALNSNYQFLRGLADSGAGSMTDQQIVAEAWGQEEEIRVETESWVFGFLLMAFHPLSDAELQAYIDYSDSPSGQALNAALFEGFDARYREISYDLGRLVADMSTASDL